MVTLETITLVYIKKISNIINNQDICRKIGPSFIENRFTICSQKHIALITKCCLFLFPNMFLCNFLNILFGRVFQNFNHYVNIMTIQRYFAFISSYNLKSQLTISVFSIYFQIFSPGLKILFEQSSKQYRNWQYQLKKLMFFKTFCCTSGKFHLS